MISIRIAVIPAHGTYFEEFNAWSNQGLGVEAEEISDRDYRVVWRDKFVVALDWGIIYLKGSVHKIKNDGGMNNRKGALEMTEGKYQGTPQEMTNLVRCTICYH